ncbi:MAG TPA: hypothetical protein VF290_07670 [Pyrinomonadaceae bacterium]
MPAEALEFFDWIANAVAGWRYLFSSSFRRRTHARWKAAGRGTALIEIVFGALGIVFTLFLLGLVVYLFRS